MSTMKVIFLDIDGVMNSQVFYHERYKRRWLKLDTYKWWLKSKARYIRNGFKHKPVSLANHVIPPERFEFPHTFGRLKSETDKLKWRWLSEFCNEHDYKICVSSVWKNNFKNDGEWNKALVNLGFNDDIFVGITGNRKSIRGEEIKEWIDNNNVEAYAIIDDDSDMLDEQLVSFFHVDGYYGLTPNTLYKINRHFLKKTKK